MSGFVGDLSVRLLDDTAVGSWALLETLGYGVYTVPVGFVTDFCSVPRVPLAYDLLGNRARKSGTVHDYLYSTHPCTRKEADQMLRVMLLDDGASELEASMFYAAVRLFGASHW